VLVILSDRTDRSLQRSEQAAERDLLLVRERLAAENQDGAAIERRLDLEEDVPIDGEPQVDAGYLAGEERMQRLNEDSHDSLLLSTSSLERIGARRYKENTQLSDIYIN
jgi:hypothetical protein